MKHKIIAMSLIFTLFVGTCMTNYANDSGQRRLTGETAAPAAPAVPANPGSVGAVPAAGTSASPAAVKSAAEQKKDSVYGLKIGNTQKVITMADLEKFAPVYYFDKYEQFFPSSIEAYLKGATLWEYADPKEDIKKHVPTLLEVKDQNGQAVTALTPEIISQYRDKNKKYVLDLPVENSTNISHNDAYRMGNLDEAKLYVAVEPLQSGDFRIYYMTLYPWNGPQGLALNGIVDAGDNIITSLLGAGAGAAAGAAIGAFGGPIGAGLGAGIGAIVGFATSIFSSLHKRNAVYTNFAAYLDFLATHEGDLEYVAVDVDSQFSTVKKLTLNRHGDDHEVTSDIAFYDTNRQHPVIAVALNSHAPYSITEIRQDTQGKSFKSWSNNSFLFHIDTDIFANMYVCDWLNYDKDVAQVPKGATHDVRWVKEPWKPFETNALEFVGIDKNNPSQAINFEDKIAQNWVFFNGSLGRPRDNAVGIGDWWNTKGYYLNGETLNQPAVKVIISAAADAKARQGKFDRIGDGPANVAGRPWFANCSATQVTLESSPSRGRGLLMSTPSPENTDLVNDYNFGLHIQEAQNAIQALPEDQRNFVNKILGLDEHKESLEITDLSYLLYHPEILQSEEARKWGLLDHPDLKNMISLMGGLTEPYSVYDNTDVDYLKSVKTFAEPVDILDSKDLEKIEQLHVQRRVADLTGIQIPAGNTKPTSYAAPSGQWGENGFELSLPLPSDGTALAGYSLEVLDESVVDGKLVRLSWHKMIVTAENIQKGSMTVVLSWPKDQAFSNDVHAMYTKIYDPQGHVMAISESFEWTAVKDANGLPVGVPS